MDEKNRVELSDDILEVVVGGIDVGDRVQMNLERTAYCPKCGKLINDIEGIIAKQRSEGVYYVKLDCCGYMYPCGTAINMIEL